MSENIDASRILMRRSAFDPLATPTRARNAGASEPGERAGWSNALAISGFVAAAPASVRSRFLSIPLRVIAMLDVVLIAVGVGFFVASILYVLACERM